MSQTYNLGKVAITPRGAYSSTAQYTPLDILSHNGSSYLVLQNCMGVTPPNATYYMVVASKGDTGSSGASPTIAAGTVTMTPAGTSASVTNVGTNVNASFNFTLPNGNVIYTGTGVTGTSTTPTVFSGSGVSNAGVGDIYFNTSTVAFYRCALGGNASTAKWAFLTYAVPDGSVTTDKIADSAVTTNKINDGAVGVDEIANGSVSYDKLGNNVKSLETATQEMFASIDADDSFDSGDYVVYNPTNTSPFLYRFTADKTSGAWDGTKVYLTNVGNELNNRVEKDSIQNAGIFDATYETIFNTASATTSIHSNKQYPWVQISSTADKIQQNNFYRVTFDGVEYTLNADMWFADNRSGKSATLLGNATYWGDIDGFLYPINNVPFLVTGLMSDGNTNTEGIFLFTETAGTHTIKIERASYDFNKIPPLLISGYPHLAVHLLNGGENGYNAISVGENIMKHMRSTIACGTENEVSNQLAIAFGQLNKVSGEVGKAFGRGNTVSGSGAVGIGEYNTASGLYSVAIGRQNTASENSSTALGYHNTASGGYATAGGAGSVASGGVATAIGYGTVANHLCQTAIGMYNEADASTATAGNRGNYIEIVGNGTGDNARSNARTLDWDGNESLAGGLTLGKGTANEVSITAQQLQQLLALLN